jgi:ribosomal protein S18 acetylase RimI-like enzyme
MKEASLEDKSLIVDILTRSFENNQSINYLIPQDSRRKERIRNLMDYSFELCREAGRVLLSDDRKACALLILPERKKTTWNSLRLSLFLITKSIGFRNIPKALNREGRIAARHPKTPYYHLWFIGVAPEHQGRGRGGQLLREILEEAENQHRPVYLETSTLKNLPWYEKHGFEIFDRLELSYTLYLLRWKG